MKKRKLIIALLTILILLIIIVSVVLFVRGNNQNKKKSMESSVLSSSDIDGVYNGAKDDVDAGVATLMQLDGYKLSDTEKKKDYVEILLKKYQDNGTISELVCDKENVRYTFTYNEGELKGALGGIYFGDFDQ